MGRPAEWGQGNRVASGTQWPDCGTSRRGPRAERQVQWVQRSSKGIEAVHRPVAVTYATRSPSDASLVLWRLTWLGLPFRVFRFRILVIWLQFLRKRRNGVLKRL